MSSEIVTLRVGDENSEASMAQVRVTSMWGRDDESRALRSESAPVLASPREVLAVRVLFEAFRAARRSSCRE